MDANDRESLEIVARIVAATAVIIVSLVVMNRIWMRLSESKNGRLISLLVWPGLPVVFGIWDGFSEGWDRTHIVGVAVASLLFATFLMLYRRHQRKKE